MQNKERDEAFFHYKQASHRLLADSQGNPLTVYHATSKIFELLRPLSHFGSYQAATGRIRGSYSETKHLAFEMSEHAGSEKDILRSIDFMFGTVKKLLKKEKEVKRYENEPYYIPAHLALYNPKVMPEMGFYRTGYKDDLMYRLIENDLLFQFRFYKHMTKSVQYVMALKDILKTVEVSPVYDFIFKDPFKIPEEAVRYELGLETLYPIWGANDVNIEYQGLKDAFPKHPLHNNMFINRSNLSMQRMIRYWENKGYDGFIYEDTVDDMVEEREGMVNTINKKPFPNFSSIKGRGSFAYVIFRSGQVIRLDRPLEYQLSPLYPPVKNQQKLNEIEQQTLSKMAPRKLSKNERSRMEAWYYEDKNFYLHTRE